MKDEVVSELAVRLNDLLQKWTKTCTSADEVRDRVVQEQLLNFFIYRHSHMGQRA